MQTNEIKNMNENKEWSAYKLCWVEYRAVEGKVKKTDAKILSKSGQLASVSFYTPDRLYDHFPSREKAEEWVSMINKEKLSKKYEVRFFTDKQYSLAKKENGYAIPFTSKQEKEMFVI